ncbi:unnamed protein product [Zymoseptoria tritici ST99CH_3D1]|uniref:BTB domain-containing protein n=1 Tax=Zymoseptoria tritici ST99CH_1E4 TaxID=1276532 RepID=A0A2H1GPZ7_ZYMTR|nr:unnamed protein product [Zymoseptoria tritici ST99CH_1E4]SMR58028.1 unnamed protein product [Zymoseptoria tritici ST99CH_3D1]
MLPSPSLQPRPPLQSRAINVLPHQSPSQYTNKPVNCTRITIMATPSVPRMVNVFVRISDNEREHISTLQRTTLEARSSAFRAFLGQPVANEHDRDVTLPSGSPRALRHVLNTIKWRGHHPEMFISITGMTFTEVVGIWEVCNMISLEPQRVYERVTAHIIGHVSHNPATAEIVNTVHQAMRPSKVSFDAEKERPWRAMIHQMVWDEVHNSTPPAEKAAIQSIVGDNPDLRQAVNTKMADLRAKKDAYDAQSAANRTRIAAERNAAAQRGRGQRGRGQRGRGQHAGNEEDRRWAQAREVRAGTREWTPQLGWYVDRLRR